jgi:hypothetical protein
LSHSVSIYYLRKAYKIAVQCMNAWTWKECCAEAIKSLRDCGINYVDNEETIRRWHIYFRKHETFPNPLGHSKKLQEPKVFDFFPELKLKIHEFCAHPDNQPSECCCVPQQSEHRDVPTIFGEGAGLHAWLSSPSLGSERRKRRSQEF